MKTNFPITVSLLKPLSKCLIFIRQGAIVLVLLGLSLLPLFAQASFWDHALQFGKQLLATAAGNYANNYQQDLTQLLLALRQPGTANQPLLQGITPDNIPGNPYDPNATSTQNPYGQNNPYAQQAYPQDPYGQQPAQQGYPNDPNGQQGYANDPYAQQAYPQDPNGQQPAQQGYPNDPNGQQGYANDPYAQQAYPQDPYGQQPAQQGYPNDPNGQQGYANDPYAQQAYPQDPYGQQPAQQGYPNDPNGQQGYANDPYAQQAYPQDPYGQQPAQQGYPNDLNGQQGYANDPYAQQAYPQNPPTETEYSGQGGIVGTPVGLDVAIVKKTQMNGAETLIPIKDGDLLKDGRGNAQAGDKFRIMFRANCDCYVYVIAIDGSAWAQGIFPTLSSPFSNPIKQGQQYIIPENNNWLSLDQFKGIETLFFVASPEKRQDIEDILANIAGKERHPKATPQQVTEAPIIPTGYYRSQAGSSPFIIGQELSLPQGQDHNLIPTTYFTQKAGEALRVTRWFRHE